jgi:2-iminobutanoate/2-iminopropanoate deaminase
MHEIISGTDLPKLGPYSPAVRVGQLVFVSAQAGVDPATGDVPAGGIEAECRQALANLANVLRAAGVDLPHVVKTTLLYTDVADLPTINQVYAEVFAADPPARTAAMIGLPGGRRIAIDAIAAAD